MALSIRELDYIADRVAAIVVKRIQSEDVMLNSEQVAEMLGVTRQCVTQQVRRGELPALRKGRNYYFSRRQILTHLLTNSTITKTRL